MTYKKDTNKLNSQLNNIKQLAFSIDQGFNDRLKKVYDVRELVLRKHQKKNILFEEKIQDRIEGNIDHLLDQI